MTAQHYATRLSAAGLLACLLALPACRDRDSEGGLLAGTWIGRADFTLSDDLIAPSLITLYTNEYVTGSVAGEYTGTGEVFGTMTIEARGQSVCAPITGNHEYPDFSLRFALAGEEVTGRYVGKATIRNCTSKFTSPDWCGMDGTFSTDDGAVSEALTLTLHTSAPRPTLDPSTGQPVCE